MGAQGTAEGWSTEPLVAVFSQCSSQACSNSFLTSGGFCSVSNLLPSPAERKSLTCRWARGYPRKSQDPGETVPKRKLLH